MLSSPTKPKPVSALAARPSSPLRSPRATVVVSPPKSVADWALPTTTSDLPLRPVAVPNVDADTAGHDDDDDEPTGYADEVAEMQGILAAMAAEFDAAESTDIAALPTTVRDNSGTAASDVIIPFVHRSAPAGPWSTHLSTAPADLEHTFWHEVDRADWIISLALRAAFPHAYAGAEGENEEDEEGADDEADSDEDAKKKKDDEEKTVPVGLSGGFPLLDVPDAALDALERVLGEGATAQVATEPVPT
ncbi:hypothetical protein AMAG_03810 [Allomyces macrogynus ATCC 38327]|uniref:Uncharacterized protein n=1 Tax=Allomyces macrogynus (strain ATCC 38327) TaxID=578462 RepID=A0A0L0SAY8_ALLM3|nr:hypothetical protein AMAG_03810 [Allomyces macrogynus ATCC 38327]|eukprot:KNE59550.1 hypothetical protein AMAG_03810 [Allomyces macrogynus ATCC 38327]